MFFRPTDFFPPAASPVPEPEIELNPDFLTALGLLEDDARHVFVTGRAGTGKSTLLRHFLKRTRRNAAVLAPTGVAALNVGGQTVHSFFGFSPGITSEQARRKGAKKAKDKLIQGLDMIIIDEASMARADLIDRVDDFLRAARGVDVPFGGVRLACIGDLYQLPPVVRREEQEFFAQAYPSPYFFGAHAVREVIGKGALAFVELTTVYRQKDDRFVRILNAVRDKSVDDALLAQLNERVRPDPRDWPKDAVHLVPTNAQADEINRARLARLPGRAAEYVAETSGKFEASSFPTDDVLALKPGAAVMFLNNDAAGRWVNGSLGTVQATFPDHVTVRMTEGGEVHEVEPHAWEMTKYRYDPMARSLVREAVGTFRQIPVFLAWAITVHKSQGKTFQALVADLSRTFAPGQAYVALSRCVSLEGLYLAHPLRHDNVRLDYSVVTFLTSLRCAAAQDGLTQEGRVALLEEAASRDLPVTLSYLKDRDATMTRVFWPRRVAMMEHAGKPFLGVEGYCETWKDDRVLGVQRIVGVELGKPKKRA